MSSAIATHKPNTGLAGTLAAALDPVIFARSIGVEPDPWQASVLRSDARRVLLNCSRQSGKSTTTALVALHTALYTSNALVLVLAPSQRQSAEMFRTVAGLYGRTGGSVPPTAESALRLELSNGSRIVSLPASADKIRGFAAVHTLVIDEAAFTQDELYLSVLPMLATTNGRLLALSTPFGRTGWWAEAWFGNGDWERVEVTAHDCPRITPEFLQEQRESMGDWWFRQEFLCEFLDDATSLFSSEDLLLAQTREQVETWEIL